MALVVLSKRRGGLVLLVLARARRRQEMLETGVKVLQ